MKQLNLMVKPASSLCDVRCEYCFYRDVSERRQAASKGVMSREAAEQLLKNVASGVSPGDRLRFTFQGGEPTLAGLDFFQHFVRTSDRLLSGCDVRFALQTNGLLLDASWIDFLYRRQFLVGLSLDIYPEAHDRYRKDARGEGTYAAALEAYHALRRHEVDVNILAVLTEDMARKPQRVWHTLLRENVEFVQFIPCLGPLDGGASMLAPSDFAFFYTRLFDKWYDALRRGRYISVKLFDDLVHLLAHGQRNACGLTGTCAPQLVIESDGACYPCDFYALDEWEAGNLCRETLQQVYEADAMRRFRLRPMALPEACETCRYRPICGGGCPRMRSAMCAGPGETGCGYRTFLNAALPRIAEIAKYQ